jgi:hypothetical protein
MQRHAAGIGIRQRGLIERPLERGHEGVHVCLRRTTDARRGHQPAAQLSDNLLPDVSVVADASKVHRVEREICSLSPLVVTANAIRIEECA